MNDYTITIKKNNKNICTVGGRYMNYDNVIWWQLSELIKIATSDFESNEELVKKIESETEYFHLCDDDQNSAVLDLDNNTIESPMFPVFANINELKEEYPEDYRVINGEHFIAYSDGEMYKMMNVKFDDINLLNKIILSFDEFNKVVKFIDQLLLTEELTFVLNDNMFIRLNNI